MHLCAEQGFQYVFCASGGRFWVYYVTADYFDGGSGYSLIPFAAISKSRRSAFPPKVRGAHTQSEGKIRPQQEDISTSGKTTPKTACHSRHAKSSSKGRSSSTRGRSGRRTGGKGCGAKTLVLSSCANTSIVRDVEVADVKISDSAFKKRTKRTHH